MHRKFKSDNLKKRNCYGDLHIYSVLQKKDIRMWSSEFKWLRTEDLWQVLLNIERYFKSSKKGDECIDQLRCYQLICEHSASQSKSVTDNIQFKDIKLSIQYSPE
jgi:hypothetical protein